MIVMKTIGNYFVIPGLLLNPIDICCQFFNVSESDLKSSSRKLELIEARQFGMLYANRVLKLSTTQTGALFNRDHVTVIHALRNVRRYYETEKDFKQRLTDFLKLTNNDQEIEKLIYGDSLD